jgi:hypothetical protein
MVAPAGAPNQDRRIISTDNKPGAFMTFVFDSAPNCVPAIEFKSYLTEREDAVNLSIQFA